jgi:heme exporter protein A
VNTSGSALDSCTRGNRILHLTVRQLAKAYGLLWALRNVTFEVSAGDFVALLGPNGAGKSTLLKLLANLAEPTRGEILLDGIDVLKAASSLRSTVGLLTPAEHLYDNLTVRENLRFFTSLYKKKIANEDIDAALAGVNLIHRADEIVAALSSGMRCRLSIAKWELLQPGLLLLDEPYGVLDGNGVNLLEEFLNNHCRKGNIVIMASHHVARALNLCTRAMILHQGRLTFDEPRQQPWESFKQAFGDFLPHGESWTS